MEDRVINEAIPLDVADRLCDEIRGEASANWDSALARWCWGCRQSIGDSPEKKGYLQKPGNRGCHLINVRYAEMIHLDATKRTD